MKHFVTLAAIFVVINAFAQTGTSISGIINIYTPVNAVDHCANSVTVGSSAGFSVGDRVLLIQMKGATIDQTNTATYGNILSYGGAGTYEFGNIASVNGTTIQFVNKILYTYAPASIVQLVRVPQYVNAVVAAPLTCQVWNGATGGILALEASGTLYLNANINVSNSGFAGGSTGVNNGSCHTQDYNAATATGEGAYKGEGIVVFNNVAGGRGKLADGGGAGDVQNAGGAGGGNFGTGGNGADGCLVCCGSNSGTGGIGGLALPYNQNLLFSGAGGGGGQQNNSEGTNGGNGGGIIIITANAIVAGAGDSIVASGQQGGDLAAGNASDGEGGGGSGGTVVVNAQGISGAVIPINVQGGKGGDNHAGGDGPGGGGGGGPVLISNVSLEASLTVDSAGGVAGYNYTNGNSNVGAQNGQPGGLIAGFALQQETQPWHIIDTPVIAYNAPACSGSNIQFSLTGNYSSIAVYSWTGPDGFTSAVANPQVTNAAMANSGIYSVFVTDSGCTSPTVNLTVAVNPVYNYTVNVNFCAGTVYPLHNGQTITSPGTYIDSLISSLGCDSVITLNVTYSSVHVSGNVAICKGDSTQLIASNAFTYAWSPANGLSNDSIANPIASPATTTTYTVTGSQQLGNLVINGDFSLGNVGFSTGYTYATQNTTQSQYFVGPDPNAWNSGTTAFGDHTTGTGNMMLIDGSTVANVPLWCEALTVTPNTNYAFSCWIAPTDNLSPPILQFSINNQPLGNPVAAVNTPGLWQQFYIIWNSGTNTTAEICIDDRNLTANGNDFAIDDVSFSPLCDNVDTVKVTVNPTYAITVKDTICNGIAYTLPNGTTATTTGTYIDTLQTITGCDSIITTKLVVEPTYSDTANPIICPFDVYELPDGNYVHTSGTYITHFTSIYGCDSNVITNLTVIPSTLVAGDDTSICFGDSAQLFASGSLLNNYSWAPASGLSDSTIANPKASPLQTTTYVVTSLIGSGNLVVNGDFSQGNVGFSTDYNYNPNLVPEGNYYVGANPNSYHPGFSACPDHTTGTGNQMIINGASTANTNVWCQTISVSPNTSYTFIAWGQSVTQGNPAQLQFSINGSQIGPIFNLPLPTCQWSQFFTTWNSGANTSASICILNQQTAAGGNDFAIDDISFVSLCTAYDSVTVTVHHPDTILLSPVICQGPTYTFPDGTTAIATATDTARYTNQFGCDSTIITNLTVHPVYHDTIIDTICFGTSYILPSHNAVNTSGTYIDTLATIFGCDSIIVTELTVTNPPVTFVFDTICFGTSQVLPLGNTVNTAGTYVDTLTTTAGCDSVVIVNLTVTAPPVTTQNDTICQGNTFVRPSGLTTGTAGIYVDTLTTSLGCDSVIITNLTVNPTSATTVYDTICQGFSFTLGNGNTVSTSGSYPVTLPNRFGCDSVATTILTVIDDTLTATETNPPCYGQSKGTIQATASQGLAPYTYALSSGGSNTNGLFTGLIAGNYVVTVTDNFHCSATANVTIGQPDSLQVFESVVDLTCYNAHNGQVRVEATGGTPAYTYFLNGQGSSTGSYYGLDTGSYTGSVMDANGCTDSAVAEVNQPQPVYISFSPDSLFVNLGHPLQLNATSNYDPSTTYLWSPSFGLSCVDCPDPIVDINSTAQYNVLVTANINGNDCTGDTSITVTVIPDYDLFIPNVFTPNNDGKNDFFQIFGNVSAIRLFHISIFDRIGEVVFESDDVYFKWDGTYKGQPLNPSVFVYTIKAVFDDGHSDKLFSGSITLLK